ncbi:MAG TPA: cytochrome c3 family protein [Terriglobales bacterium]|nr:cytochrome c3 family protein [Terriglobales bacterium]
MSRQKRLAPHVKTALALLCLVLSPAASAKPSESQASDGCAGCHADFSSVLPKGHPAVNGTGLASCLPCHSLGQAGEAKKNGFSTRIHLTHAGPQLHLECVACHGYVSGKSFGLIGQSISWGAPKDEDMAIIKEVFASWVNSSYTDHLHAQAMVDCAGCHGKEVPLPDTTVENNRCLTCHGPQDQLAARSRPQDFPKRNPHDSHLGEIACTVCHHAHAESKVYCLDCHRNFTMKIPGGK